MVRSFNKARRGRRAGFTLIELLVVVLILGILLAVAIPLYLSSVRNSGTRTVQANIRTLANAAQAYRVRTGVYPATMGQSGFIGAGLDLTSTPSGPGTTSYTLTGTANTDAVITASEGSTDTFGTSTTGESITYQLSSGAFTPAL
jgi:type IV pilus assembly protein PilA